MTFIDTNIFIRAITRDNLEMALLATSFFEKVKSGKIIGFIEDSTVAEALFVLMAKKHYNLTRIEATVRLKIILEIGNIHHDYKDQLMSALDKFADSNLDFVDCLALSYKDAGIVDEIFSFDKKVK